MNAQERKAKLKEFTDNPDTAVRTGIPITYHNSIITLNAYAIPLEYLVYNGIAYAFKVMMLLW